MAELTDEQKRKLISDAAEVAPSASAQATPGGISAEVAARLIEAAAAQPQRELSREGTGIPGPGANPDGTYGQPPAGFITDPRTGAMTSQELLANRERPSAAGAFRTGTEEGVMWGGRDEAAGAIGAAAVGSGGDMGSRYDIEQMRARAEMAAARRDHPVASIGGEMLGAVLSGGAMAGAGKGIARGVAPAAYQKVAQALAASVPARMAAGFASGALGAGSYGFATGEGGLEPRMDQAIGAGAFGAGVGAAVPLAGAGIEAYLNRRATGKAADAMIASTPSADELLARGGQMIDDAVATGTTATPDQTKALAQSMRQTLMENGVIGPQGRVIAGGRPKINDAMTLADEFFGQSMTPAQMRSVRKALQTAAQSTDGQEARLGAMLLEQFDNWSTPMMPQIPAANALYTAGKRGELIDEAVELAGIRAGQFSGSGYENALRTEFRGLARKIAKGQLKGLSAEQIEAINRVASGGPIENLARGIGKAAPTSIVNVAGGGGIPFLVGNALGGPGVGAAVGLGTMGAGHIGRKAATAMQTKNAAVASALMRGGQMPAITSNPAVNRVAEQMLRNALVPTVQ